MPSDSFTGAACSRLSCAGTADACNAHGQCLDMYTLAKLSTVNGVIPTAASMGYTISYGALPNNPKTWDALKLFGCLCDAGYTGYDCSQKTCPFGDDPATGTVSAAPAAAPCCCSLLLCLLLLAPVSAACA